MKKILIIVIVVCIAAAGYWAYTAGRLPDLGDGRLDALDLSADKGETQVSADSPQVGGSGTIEAEEIVISSELGGRIVSISAGEGDEVEIGQVLIELDTADLLAEKSQAEAAINTAQANLAEVKTGPRPVDIAAAQAEVDRSQATVDQSEQLWREAQTLVHDPQEIGLRLQSLRGQLVTAEKNIELAQTRLKEAQIEYDEALRNQNGDAAVTAQQIAQKQVAVAEVDVEIAEASRDGIKAQISGLERMQGYPVQLIVNANQAQSAYSMTLASVKAAQANLEAVSAPPRPEDLAVAQAQLTESKAAAARIDVLLDDLVLRSPRQGVVLERTVRVGELAAPGRVLMKLADLNSVELVVFVPENQIGLVQEGQKASVKVDAFPDDVFEGVVSYIAPEAEYTPKNVQTKEERVNLVFQVKIRLDNQDRRLKPGMPADALILEPSQN